MLRRLKQVAEAHLVAAHRLLGIRRAGRKNSRFSIEVGLAHWPKGTSRDKASDNPRWPVAPKIVACDGLAMLRSTSSTGLSAVAAALAARFAATVLAPSPAAQLVTPTVFSAVPVASPAARSRFAALIVLAGGIDAQDCAEGLGH